VRRLEVCKACDAELHCCRLCEFHDTTVAKHCREPIAEEVKDKTRANFCDYFKPRPGAYIAPDSAAARARTELDAMFGGGATPPAGDESTPARSALDELFGRK
jgi:hypothetical protein